MQDAGAKDTLTMLTTMIPQAQQQADAQVSDALQVVTTIDTQTQKLQDAFADNSLATATTLGTQILAFGNTIADDLQSAISSIGSSIVSFAGSLGGDLTAWAQTVGGQVQSAANSSQSSQGFMSVSSTTVAGTLAAASIGGYKDAFFASLKSALSDVLGEGWRVHHLFQQAAASLSPGLNLDDISNLVGVPDFIHQKITTEQGQFWQARYNALKSNGITPAGKSVEDIIAASGNRSQLLKEYEDLMASIKTRYGSFFLKPGADLNDLNKVATALGQKPPAKWTSALANDKIFGDAAEAAFAKGNGRRLAGFAANLKTSAFGKGVMGLAFINLVIMAGNTAQAADSVQFAELMTAYENALNFELENGYKSGDLTSRTLEKFRSFMDFIGTGDNAVFLGAWTRYYAQALATEN